MGCVCPSAHTAHSYVLSYKPLVLLQALGDAVGFFDVDHGMFYTRANCRHFWEYFEKSMTHWTQSQQLVRPSPHNFVATKARQWRPVFDASVSVLPTRMNWHDEWIPLEDIRMDQNRPVMPVHTMELASFCVSPSQRRVFSPKRSFRLIRRPDDMSKYSFLDR